MGLPCAALSRPPCSSAGLQGTPGWRRVSLHQAARRGAGLTAARSRGLALAAAAAASGGDRAAALQRICTLERLNLELSLGRPVSEPELSAFAAGCMDAGMSESGVSGLLMKYPTAFHLEHSALAPKLAIVRDFMDGHMEGATNAFAYDMLCIAVAQAAVKGRSDEAVQASCAALGQLLAAAHGDVPRGAAVLSVPHRVQRDLLCSWDGQELLSRFQELASREGWTPRRAAAELLSIDLQDELHDLSLLDELAQQEE